MPPTDVSGIQIRYECAGSGPALLFISGTSGDLRVPGCSTAAAEAGSRCSPKTSAVWASRRRARECNSECAAVILGAVRDHFRSGRQVSADEAIRSCCPALNNMRSVDRCRRVPTSPLSHLRGQRLPVERRPLTCDMPIAGLGGCRIRGPGRPVSAHSAPGSHPLSGIQAPHRWRAWVKIKAGLLGWIVALIGGGSVLAQPADAELTISSSGTILKGRLACGGAPRRCRARGDHPGLRADQPRRRQSRRRPSSNLCALGAQGWPNVASLRCGSTSAECSRAQRPGSTRMP
jgi:hypothetical protein